jgi:hypothetical protein
MSWTSVDENGVRREHWEGNVSCLSVRGARATMVGQLTFASPEMHPGQGLALIVEDGGDGADRVGVGFPLLTQLGGTCPVWSPFVTLSSGDIVVEDEQPDQVPPAVTIEGTLEVPAESPEGGWVTLHVTATDDLDGPVSAWCDQNQGGLFAIGSHSITCFASDLTGNTGASTVEIRVKGAREQVVDLRASVQNLALPPGQLRSLDEPLAKVDAALAADEVEESCEFLQRFERELDDLPAKKLSAEQMLELEADAVRIRAVAGC